MVIIFHVVDAIGAIVVMVFTAVGTTEVVVAGHIVLAIIHVVANTLFIALFVFSMKRFDLDVFCDSLELYELILAFIVAYIL